MNTADLPIPARDGSRPTTTPSNPHTQLDQNAPVELQDQLRDHALSLPGVTRGTSSVSVPGTVAFFLFSPVAEPTIPDILGGEWGHIHPHSAGGLHINVPTELADRLIEAGWAEYHTLIPKGVLPPLVVMLYGPRDPDELSVCKSIVEEAYLAAGGQPTDQSGRALGLSA